MTNINNYGMSKEHTSFAENIFKHLETIDFENGDYFCFKSGGDGDNGEFLKDLLDDYIRCHTCENCIHFDKSYNFVSTEVHLCKKHKLPFYNDEYCSGFEFVGSNLAESH